MSQVYPGFMLNTDLASLRIEQRYLHVFLSEFRVCPSFLHPPLLPCEEIPCWFPKAVPPNRFQSPNGSLQEWNLECEAPKIAKLVYNSNNYGLWYL